MVFSVINLTLGWLMSKIPPAQNELSQDSNMNNLQQWVKALKLPFPNNSWSARSGPAGPGFDTWFRAFLCGICMLSLCVRGLPLGILAFSHSPKSQDRLQPPDPAQDKQW